MPKETMVKTGRGGSRKNKSTRPKGRPPKNAAPKAAGQDANDGPAPKLKLRLNASKPSETQPNDEPGVTAGRGKRTKKNAKYKEAMGTLLASSQGIDDNADGADNKDDADQDANNGIDLMVYGEPSNGAAGYQLFETHASTAETADFIDSIHPDVVVLFNSLAQAPDIHMELPELTRPNPDPDLANIVEYDIVDAWTSTKLFHLYILAYNHNAYHICDLVVDNWIREFQKQNKHDKTTIWQPNRADYYKKCMRKPPRNDNGELATDRTVTTFNLDLLSELYNHTNEKCGARAMWADAMALCGKWLRAKIGKPGFEKERWPPELLWDVLHMSLGLVRVRLTSKIEEPDPKEWCMRYHEHDKHGSKCYRVLVREKNEAEDEAERAAAQAYQDAQANAHNGGSDVMDLDGGQQGSLMYPPAN
jgi:hypothetical protein